MVVLFRDGALRWHTDADGLVTLCVLAFARFEPSQISRTVWVGGLSEFALQGSKSRNAFHRRGVGDINFRAGQVIVNGIKRGIPESTRIGFQIIDAYPSRRPGFHPEELPRHPGSASPNDRID